MDPETDYKFVLDWNFIQTIIWTIFISVALMTVYTIGNYNALNQLKYMDYVCSHVGYSNVQFDYNNSRINIRPAINTSVINDFGLGR